MLCMRAAQALTSLHIVQTRLSLYCSQFDQYETTLLRTTVYQKLGIIKTFLCRLVLPSETILTGKRNATIYTCGPQTLAARAYHDKNLE